MAWSSKSFYTNINRTKKLMCGTINLIAKVIEIGIPKKSSGTDLFLTLKLVDESEPLSRFFATIFEKNLVKLPKVRSPGDIISLHRVELNAYGGQCGCTFKKHISSFALFDGKTGGALTPYQTSSIRKYQATDYDETILQHLRELPLIDQEIEEYTPSLICNIKPDMELDIVCKVLNERRISNGGWMLNVWDATDSPIRTLSMDLDMEQQATTSSNPEAYVPSREALHEFPKVGTILEISFGEAFVGISWLKGGGHWVKLCNIIFTFQSGIWSGLVQSSSKVRILCEEHVEVLHRKRIYGGRLASSMQCLPISSFPFPSSLTATDFDYGPYSTLMQSLVNPKVVHVFRTVVRVVAAFPWRATDLLSPNGYNRVRLTLEDPTARVHAYIFEEDGENFFDGYPTHDVLTKKMNKLLGMRDTTGDSTSSRDPPWVWFSLKSYFVDNSDQFTSRRYQILGTKLIG